MIAPSLSDLPRSTSTSMSIAATLPRPSHAGHMPSGALNEKTLDIPTCGVPRVEREFAPIRSWSTMIAALRLVNESTSGRPWLDMNDCRTRCRSR